MINILIYDIAGGHHDTVKATVEHYTQTAALTFFQYYAGFQGPYGQSILDYVQANSIDIIVIPYSGLSFNGVSLAEIGVLSVRPYSSSLTSYQACIQCVGGVNGAEDHTVSSPSLDFYGTSANLGDSIATSYLCGKVAGLAADLMDAGYTNWQARQILRQNCNAYNSWTQANGYGKLPDSITIPGSLDNHPPVSVTVPEPTISSLNQGLGVLTFAAPGNSFTFGGENIVASASPYIIEGQDRQYTITWDTEYGSEYASLTFTLGQYTPTSIPEKIELLSFKNTFGNRRFFIGRDLNYNYYPDERMGDQVEYNVYQDDVLIFNDKARHNSDEVVFEPSNNPGFSLDNSGGEVYEFEFRLLNEYGQGPWSDRVTIIDDEQDRSQVFDLRSTGGDGTPDPDPPPEEPVGTKKIIGRYSFGNTSIRVNGEDLVDVDVPRNVELDLDDVYSLVFKHLQD